MAIVNINTLIGENLHKAVRNVHCQRISVSELYLDMVDFFGLTVVKVNQTNWNQENWGVVAGDHTATTNNFGFYFTIPEQEMVYGATALEAVFRWLLINHYKSSMVDSDILW